MFVPRVAMTWPMMERGECRINGRLVLLPPQERDLLSALLLAGPRWFTNAEAIEMVWPNADKEPETADKHVTVLVHKLRKLGVPIETRMQFGLRIPEAARTNAPIACRQPHNCQRRKLRGYTKEGWKMSNPWKLCQPCENGRRNEDMKYHGLTKTQVEMWRSIRNNPGITYQGLMEMHGLSHSGVLKRLSPLKTKGLVRSEQRNLQKPQRGSYCVFFAILPAYRLLGALERQMRTKIKALESGEIERAVA